MKPIKKSTTPIPKTNGVVANPIAIKALNIMATEIIKTSLPFPYFSPNIAAGAMATKPNIIAGKYTFQSSAFAQPNPPSSTPCVITIGIIKNAIVIIEE